MRPEYEIVVYDSICPGDSTYWNGQWIYQSGQYHDSLSSQWGCDSVSTIDVYQWPTDPDVQIVLLSGISMMQAAQFSGELLAWWDCEADTMIQSELDTLLILDSVYLINAQVELGLLLQQGDCLIKSNCVPFDLQALEDPEVYIIHVFPNPTKHSLNIHLEGNALSRVRLFTIQGKVVYDQSASSDRHAIDMSDLAAATYQLLIEDSRGGTQSRVVIKHR